MKTTAQLLEELRQNLSDHDLNSTWYRVAKVLDISEQLCYEYRKKGIVWNPQTALKSIPYLPYTSEQILLWSVMEKQKDEQVFKVLERMESYLNPHQTAA